MCHKEIVERLLLSNQHNCYNAQNLLRGFRLNNPLLSNISKEIMAQNKTKNIIQGIGISLRLNREHFMPDLQLSPNASIAYSADSDNTIQLWSIDGTLLHSLKGHTEPITSIAFNAQETLLASCSLNEGIIRVWNIKSGTCIQMIEDSESSELVLFNPQGTVLTSHNEADCDVYLWSVETGQRLHTLTHSNEADTIGFNPQGTILVTYCEDVLPEEGKIYLWNVESGTCIQTLKEWSKDEDGFSAYEFSHLKPIVAFHPQHQLFASYAYNVIHLWDIESGKCIQAVNDNTFVQSIIFNPQGTLLASCSNTGIRLWDIESGKCIRHLNIASSSITFNKEGTLLTSCSDAGIRLWDVQTGQCLASFKGNNSIFGPHNTLIINEKNIIKTWNLKNNWLDAILKNIDCSAALLLEYIGQQYMVTNKPVPLNAKLLEILPQELRLRLIAKHIILKEADKQKPNVNKRSQIDSGLNFKQPECPPKRSKPDDSEKEQ